MVETQCLNMFAGPRSMKLPLALFIHGLYIHAPGALDSIDRTNAIKLLHNLTANLISCGRAF